MPASSNSSAVYMSYVVSMGHASPRSLSSRRWCTRTRLAGFAGALGPLPYGAASAAPLRCCDLVVDRPSRRGLSPGPRVFADGVRHERDTGGSVGAARCDTLHTAGLVTRGGLTG